MKIKRNVQMILQFREKKLCKRRKKGLRLYLRKETVTTIETMKEVR